MRGVTFAPISVLGAAVCAAGLGCHGGAPPSVPASDADFYDCADETRATPYSKGMTVDSRAGAFAVKILDSTFTDPTGTRSEAPAKGSNTWTIEVDDAATAAPLDGLTIAVTPRMPDHPHGTLAAAITPLGGGTYTVAPVYLYMAGYWEVKFDIKSAAGVAATAGDPTGIDDAGADAAAGAAPVVDVAMFPICIPG